MLGKQHEDWSLRGPPQNLYKSWVSVVTSCSPKIWKAEASNPQGRLASYLASFCTDTNHSHRLRLHPANRRSDNDTEGRKKGPDLRHAVGAK